MSSHMSNTSGRLVELSVGRGNKTKTETAERCSQPTLSLFPPLAVARESPLAAPRRILIGLSIPSCDPQTTWDSDCDAAVASAVHGPPNRCRGRRHTNKLSSTITTSNAAGGAPTYISLPARPRPRPPVSLDHQLTARPCPLPGPARFGAQHYLAAHC